MPNTSKKNNLKNESMHEIIELMNIQMKFQEILINFESVKTLSASFRANKDRTKVLQLFCYLKGISYANSF